MRPDTALIQQSQIAMLSSPHKKDLSSLRGWLDRPHYGDGFLAGTVEDVWDVEKNHVDFVTFEPRGGLTYAISRFWLYVRRLFSRKTMPKGQIYYTDGSPEGHLANGILTVLASLFPMLPIVILFFIHRLLIRLVLILVFTAVSAGLLVFGIHLKSDQVLTITTVYVFQVCLLRMVTTKIC
jgi:hypothetical protein